MQTSTRASLGTLHPLPHPVATSWRPWTPCYSLPAVTVTTPTVTEQPMPMLPALDTGHRRGSEPSAYIRPECAFPTEKGFLSWKR